MAARFLRPTTPALAGTPVRSGFGRIVQRSITSLLSVLLALPITLLALSTVLPGEIGRAHV